MILAQATASLLLASVLWAPLAPAEPVDETPAGDTMIIRVEIPARGGAPATPVPSPSAVVVPAPDAGHPRPGTLPATGADAALWVGAIGLGAIAAGAAVRARRRRRA